MKSSRLRVVKKRLADGTIKEYTYGAPKAPRGAASISSRYAPDSLGYLIIQYRLSPEWRAMKPLTHRIKNMYLRPLERLGEVPAADVKRRMLLDIRDAMAAQNGNGAATAFIRTAAALFSWAVDTERLEATPLPPSKKNVLQGGEWLAWTAEEADEAIRALSAPFARVVLLGRYTGQRRGDLCAMRWSDYDGQTIKVVQEKGRKAGSDKEPLYIPVMPELKVALDEWKRDATALTILTNRYGQPWDEDNLSSTLPRALAKLGFRPGLNVHGLRKLCAATLANAGCTAHEISRITGHDTLAMVEHYTKSADQKRLARAAIAKLADYRAG